MGGERARQLSKTILCPDVSTAVSILNSTRALLFVPVFLGEGRLVAACGPRRRELIADEADLGLARLEGRRKDRERVPPRFAARAHGQVVGEVQQRLVVHEAPVAMNNGSS